MSLEPLQSWSIPLPPCSPSIIVLDGHSHWAINPWSERYVEKTECRKDGLSYPKECRDFIEITTCMTILISYERFVLYRDSLFTFQMPLPYDYPNEMCSMCLLLFVCMKNCLFDLVLTYIALAGTKPVVEISRLCIDALYASRRPLRSAWATVAAAGCRSQQHTGHPAVTAAAMGIPTTGMECSPACVQPRKCCWHC